MSKFDPSGSTLEEARRDRQSMVQDIAAAANSSSVEAPNLQSLMNDLHYVDGKLTAFEEIQATIADITSDPESTDVILATLVLSELALKLSEPSPDIEVGRYGDYVRMYRDGYMSACNDVARFFSEIVR